MARKRTHSDPNPEFVMVVVVFGVALVLVGWQIALILTILVVMGYAGWKIRRELSRRGALARWFHSHSGMNNLNDMTPLQFEVFVREVYARLGYEAELTKRSGDEGVDVLAKKDGLIYAIQVKKTAKPIGSPVIQTLLGSMANIEADRGICVASAGFTRDAQRFAAGKPIILVGQEDLARMLEHARPASS